MHFADMKISNFLDDLGSNKPAPGGGAAAALSAATGASLVMMLVNLSINKKGCEEHTALFLEIIKKANETRANLLSLMDEDAKAYDNVIACMKEAKKIGKSDLEGALKYATEVPLKIATESIKIIEIAGKSIKFGNKNVISDGVVGAKLANVAVSSSLVNARFNAKMMKDKEKSKEYLEDVNQIEKKLETLLEEISSLVNS